MLINHRNSAYMDMEEVERAAGAIEQMINSGAMPDEDIDIHQGAALMLRLLLTYDFKTSEDLLLVFERFVNDRKEGETANANQELDTN